MNVSWIDNYSGRRTLKEAEINGGADANEALVNCNFKEPATPPPQLAISLINFILNFDV